MRKLWAAVAKELLLLWRDRGGLLLLFLMPTALVLVVSLVQDNVMKATGDAAARVLVLDLDEGAAGEAVRAYLAKAPGITLVPPGEWSEDKARSAAARGDLEAFVLVPLGATEALVDGAREWAARSLAVQPQAEPEAPPPHLRVWFDPTLRGAVRAGLVRALEGVAREAEFAARTEAFEAWFQALGRQPTEAGGTLPGAGPDVRGYWRAAPTWAVAPEAASPQGWHLPPSSVQQNVPAWGLFGVFFVVVPLAGSLLRERQDGTLRRMLTMPVSPVILLLGKVLAYVAVGLVQFGLMGLLGLFVLPRLGTPVLALGDPVALAAMCLSAALAAASYGVLVGTLARSYEQASTFGAVSVVIAAALGGVMVPVYAMPPAMQLLSGWSPLGWGLRGFLAVFARGGALETVAPDALSLLLFAATCLGAAWLSFRRAA